MTSETNLTAMLLAFCDRGVRLSADKNDLLVDCRPGELTDADRATLRSHKSALIAALSGAGDTDLRPRYWPIDLLEEIRLEAAVLRQRIRQTADPVTRMKMAAALTDLPTGDDFATAYAWRDRLLDVTRNAELWRAENARLPRMTHRQESKDDRP